MAGDPKIVEQFTIDTEKLKVIVAERNKKWAEEKKQEKKSRQFEQFWQKLCPLATTERTGRYEPVIRYRFFFDKNWDEQEIRNHKFGFLINMILFLSLFTMMVKYALVIFNLVPMEYTTFYVVSAITGALSPLLYWRDSHRGGSTYRHLWDRRMYKEAIAREKSIRGGWII